MLGLGCGTAATRELLPPARLYCQGLYIYRRRQLEELLCRRSSATSEGF